MTIHPLPRPRPAAAPPRQPAGLGTYILTGLFILATLIAQQQHGRAVQAEAQLERQTVRHIFGSCAEAPAIQAQGAYR